MRGLRALALCLALITASCGGGGGGGGTSASSGSLPSTVTTPAPPAPGTSTAAFTCPTADSATSVAQSPPVAGEAVRRAPATHATAAPSAGATTLIAVTYDRDTALRSASAISSREQSLGATVIQTYDFPHAGLVTHLLSVPTSQVNSIESALRSQTGVHNVGPAGARRYRMTVTAPGDLTNDPYFKGFAGTSAPYYEASPTPGQWDMHAIELEHAFAYSQTSNGSAVSNPSAIGSSSVKIAVIDTGQDTGHPELNGKIAYQKCFITATNNVQSASNFTTDPDGHGTDVTGIAGAATGNGLGFAGAGGNSSIYAYRIFPTPDNNCSNPNTTDPQCGSSTVDEVAALQDAINNHVNVINLSLGGDGCTNGQDPDPAEGAAINDALAANIVVVAASGNNGPNAPVTAPACVTGVIAVGASALDDGKGDGSNHTGGTSGSPQEYVASYSGIGSPAASVHNPSAWGIVAPGGDPTNDNDTDDLHWIENIWTSTPFNSSDAGTCSPDFNSNGPTDCRTLIAGTSMAAPHVAGAAALILAVNQAYQSPSQMKTLLCSTADDIGDPNEGCGRLNVYRAMAKALNDPNPPP